VVEGRGPVAETVESLTRASMARTFRVVLAVGMLLVAAILCLAAAVGWVGHVTENRILADAGGE
jgi:hypothetical protein